MLEVDVVNTRPPELRVSERFGRPSLLDLLVRGKLNLIESLCLEGRVGGLISARALDMLWFILVKAKSVIIK